ncbi:COR domain-containing protein [Dapis sp. BLCC M229]|uniref:COR domain-containing protein n=1 Tax=Dapis sp. BLCC M229 TaxID=3400188 RepID=UPI003CF7231E
MERNKLDSVETIAYLVQNGKNNMYAYQERLTETLYFREYPLLNKTVILKPEWGTAAVYKALDNPKVYDNFGKFTKDDLVDIWHESIYANMHDELLQLIIKFQLCYQIPHTYNTYVATQLLTPAKPEYDWDENYNLILRYTYEFMPKGIITQLARVFFILLSSRAGC